MNRNCILFFALVLSSALAGCCTPKKTPAILPSPDRARIELPVTFRGYNEAYKFIAACEVSDDPDALLQFAADSSTTICALDGSLRYVWVVEPHFYNGGIYDRIRGATGNGSYYVLRPLARDFTSLNTNCGFELIGVAEGNTFRWSSLNGNPRFITTWHVSAVESPESIYQWNGRFFERVQSEEKK